MELVRTGLSELWTLASAIIVVSLGWFLVESRKDRVPRSGEAATALILVFGGLMLTQLYMALIVGEPTTRLTPYWPLALAAAICLFGGVTWTAWLFRPRRVPLVLFGIIVVVGGVLIALGRLYLQQ